MADNYLTKEDMQKKSKNEIADNILYDSMLSSLYSKNGQPCIMLNNLAAWTLNEIDGQTCLANRGFYNYNVCAIDQNYSNVKNCDDRDDRKIAPFLLPICVSSKKDSNLSQTSHITTCANLISSDVFSSVKSSAGVPGYSFLNTAPYAPLFDYCIFRLVSVPKIKFSSDKNRNDAFVRNLFLKPNRSKCGDISVVYRRTSPDTANPKRYKTLYIKRSIINLF